jgi:hypothetical protein
MSLATLNVWITAIGDPCHIIDEQPKRDWFVHIVDCEGKPLTWCGRSYRDLKAKCGHLQVEIPPGCYVVFASENSQGHGLGEFGNLLTHLQIVRANCGDHVCVTLFSPSAHFCGTWFAGAIYVFGAALANAGVDPKITAAALEAVQRLVSVLPADRFSTNLRAFLPRVEEAGR